jgi:hypothetical protein
MKRILSLILACCLISSCGGGSHEPPLAKVPVENPQKVVNPSKTGMIVLGAGLVVSVLVNVGLGVLLWKGLYWGLLAKNIKTDCLIESEKENAQRLIDNERGECQENVNGGAAILHLEDRNRQLQIEIVGLKKHLAEVNCLIESEKENAQRLIDDERRKHQENVNIRTEILHDLQVRNRQLQMEILGLKKQLAKTDRLIESERENAQRLIDSERREHQESVNRRAEILHDLQVRNRQLQMEIGRLMRIQLAPFANNEGQVLSIEER